MDFFLAGASTCRRECSLSKSKHVANVSLVLLLSSSVILSVMISFLHWCRVYSVPSQSTSLFIYNTFLLQVLVYRRLNTMNKS